MSIYLFDVDKDRLFKQPKDLKDHDCTFSTRGGPWIDIEEDDDLSRVDLPLAKKVNRLFYFVDIYTLDHDTIWFVSTRKPTIRLTDRIISNLREQGHIGSGSSSLSQQAATLPVPRRLTK